MQIGQTGGIEMESERGIWQGVDGKGHSIVTVIAGSEAEARERVREQLSRPGRLGFLKLWREGGQQVVLKQ